MAQAMRYDLYCAGSSRPLTERAKTNQAMAGPAEQGKRSTIKEDLDGPGKEALLEAPQTQGTFRLGAASSHLDVDHGLESSSSSVSGTRTWSGGRLSVGSPSGGFHAGTGQPSHKRRSRGDHPSIGRAREKQRSAG